MVYGGTITQEVKDNFKPKFNETDLVNAPKSKIFKYCVNPGQVAFTCKY